MCEQYAIWIRSTVCLNVGLRVDDNVTCKYVPYGSRCCMLATIHVITISMLIHTTATKGATFSYADYIMQSNNTFPQPKQTSSLPNRDTATMAPVFRSSAPSLVTVGIDGREGVVVRKGLLLIVIIKIKSVINNHS